MKTSSMSTHKNPFTNALLPRHSHSSSSLDDDSSSSNTDDDVASTLIMDELDQPNLDEQPTGCDSPGTPTCP